MSMETMLTIVYTTVSTVISTVSCTNSILFICYGLTITMYFWVDKYLRETLLNVTCTQFTLECSL